MTETDDEGAAAALMREDSLADRALLAGFDAVTRLRTELLG
jgi:hypothetical protein